MKRDEALKLRSIIEKAMSSVDDQTASNAPELFPSLKQGGDLIAAGTRINWGGVVKRAAADLWDREDTSPDNAPSLWEDLAYREGYRIIPEVITTGMAFALGECGWWGGVLYKSLIEANVYTPAAYPDGWEVA